MSLISCEINLILTLSKNNSNREGHARYYLPTVKISHVMIDGKNFFDQPIKNDTKTYDNI